MTVKKLSNYACDNAKYNPSGKGNKLSAGDGLYLHITPTGKNWRLKYRFLGKEKSISFGPYPVISILEAKAKRDEAKRQILDGKDPSELRKLQKLQLKHSYEHNFENVARKWHEQFKHTWKLDHAENILRRFEKSSPFMNVKPSGL